ncbi:MAG: hypothetical protein PHX44_10070 [Sulfurimonas sp.]|uniref:hypothetical protein n=1 Tax=Sulfurimonas sp. TaxID=2022749 RepID=UPI002601EA27|nr:hypothetical protein [Sulfurimonas sp.]MDD2653379.1 hypothetical protein [Sulfurimonas sp.]MDD3450685.1 hypothetical protein [Sulfurimonas sp.]
MPTLCPICQKGTLRSSKYSQNVYCSEIEYDVLPGADYPQSVGCDFDFDFGRSKSEFGVELTTADVKTLIGGGEIALPDGDTLIFDPAKRLMRKSN